MKYIKGFDYIVENKRNAKRFKNKGGLMRNDQFSGNVSLSKTLADELGFNPKKEFSEGIGFDNISMYDKASGKTIVDDALSGKHTYDDLVKVAKEWYKKNESTEVNEGFSSKSDFNKIRKALSQGKTVTARHARFPMAITIKEIDPKGMYATVDFNDGRGDSEMAAMNIDPKSIKISESAEVNERFREGQFIKSKVDSDKFGGDVYDVTNDVDGSEIDKGMTFRVGSVGRDEAIIFGADDEIEYSIDPKDLKHFIKESEVNERKDHKQLAQEIFDELIDVNGEEIADMDKSECMTMLKMRGIKGGEAANVCKEILRLTGSIGESADLNEAKKFKPGDMWSSDFDYEGMLRYALKVNEKTPIKMLNKLFDSATDVNYHTPFRNLGIAIDWIEDGDKKGAKDYIKSFHDDIKKEMKNQGIK